MKLEKYHVVTMLLGTGFQDAAGQQLAGVAAVALIATKGAASDCNSDCSGFWKVTQAIPFSVRLCAGLLYGLPPLTVGGSGRFLSSSPRSYPDTHRFITSLDSDGSS